MGSYREIVVPEDFIDEVRIYTGDMPEFNELIEGSEFSDEKIRLSARLWLSHFNNLPPEIPKKYTIDNFPDGKILLDGVVIQVLKMGGIIQTRNYLNFRDDNVSIQVNDKARDYQQWINMLLQEHREEVMNMKVSKNAETAYDFLHSPDGGGNWFR